MSETDPFEASPLGAQRPCERCGRSVVLIQVGSSAPVVCDLCARYENEKAGERILDGSPSETAFRQEIQLDENWR